MIDFRQMTAFTNAVVVALGEVALNTGLSMELATAQMTGAFQGSAKALLKEAGITISGSDVPSILKSAGEALTGVGFVQRFKVLEVTDGKYVLDMGECIFALATVVFQKMSGGDPNFIPPCPMNAIIFSVIQEKLGKDCTITGCEFKPEENTRIFTVEVE